MLLDKLFLVALRRGMREADRQFFVMGFVNTAGIPGDALQCT
jgi:hypothetical protein